MTTIIIKFVPWFIMALSVGAIAVIIGRKVPVLLKLPASPPEGQPQVFLLKKIFEKIILRLRGLRFSSYLPALASWAEKTLRKIRVVILKTDNLFVHLIGRSREKTQVWTVRSRAWMEQHRLKKIQKLQVLEKLDQAEILETIQKAKEEVKKEEEKNGKKLDDMPAPQVVQNPDVVEEKKCIDMIAQDPRNIEAYRQLGFLYCRQGNKDDAKNCFRQVLKLNPDDLEVISKMKELA